LVEEWSAGASLLRSSEAGEASGLTPEEVQDNRAAQQEEVLALRSIYGEEMREPAGGDGFVFEFEVAVDVPPAVALGASQAAGATCSFLPPLKLRVRFCDGYPSVAPPCLAVRCAWLSDDETEAVAAGLDAVAEGAPGEPVVCAWLEWLRSEALAAVGLDQPEAVLSLPPARREEAGWEMGGEAAGAVVGEVGGEAAGAAPGAAGLGDAASGARRAQRWPRDRRAVLASLRMHAGAVEEKEWAASLHR
jgi:hypothetical protein